MWNKDARSEQLFGKTFRPFQMTETLLKFIVSITFALKHGRTQEVSYLSPETVILSLAAS